MLLPSLMTEVVASSESFSSGAGLLLSDVSTSNWSLFRLPKNADNE